MPNSPRATSLSRRRIAGALTVAIATDGLQLLLGPLGWAFFDEALDVIAMLLIIALIGFHPLLLPSFLLELVPVADMLPTWTACVALVVALRRKQARVSEAAPNTGPVIDI